MKSCTPSCFDGSHLSIWGILISLGNRTFSFSINDQPCVYRMHLKLRKRHFTEVCNFITQKKSCSRQPIFR